jgi:sigma-B regulation protein RsbQ
MLFAHGFGCDQHMWRLLAPAFERDFKVILFDYIGHGRSDRRAYDAAKYASLHGYAADVLEIGRTLDIRRGIFVGHSVSAMVGALASIAEPEMFDRLIMIGPSPRYIDDEGYVGGFMREEIEGLLETLDSNYLGWSTSMAPVIMGAPERPALSEELANSFCRTDPEVARQFARVTFLSDNRADLRRVPARSLVLQCTDDVIAPAAVGRYVHDALPNSALVMMRATGHCPHLSAPDETVAAMKTFLR